MGGTLEPETGLTDKFVARTLLATLAGSSRALTAEEVQEAAPFTASEIEYALALLVDAGVIISRENLYAINSDQPGVDVWAESFGNAAFSEFDRLAAASPIMNPSSRTRRKLSPEGELYLEELDRLNQLLVSRGSRWEEIATQIMRVRALTRTALLEASQWGLTRERVRLVHDVLTGYRKSAVHVALQQALRDRPSFSSHMPRPALFQRELQRLDRLRTRRNFIHISLERAPSGHSLIAAVPQVPDGPITLRLKTSFRIKISLLGAWLIALRILISFKALFMPPRRPPTATALAEPSKALKLVMDQVGPPPGWSPPTTWRVRHE